MPIIDIVVKKWCNMKELLSVKKESKTKSVQNWNHLPTFGASVPP